MEQPHKQQLHAHKNKPLRLMLSSPFVQTYEFTFPNGETVPLKIACYQGIKVAAMEAIISGSVLSIQLIEDWPAWLTYLSIRKRLNQIGVSEPIHDSILHGFDAIKCTKSSQIYAIHSKQITKSLSAFIRQSLVNAQLKEKILSELNLIMNDLQELQILIGQNFSLESLRMSKKWKPVLRVDKQFSIYDIPCREYRNFKERMHPYQRNAKLVQDLLNEVFQCSPAQIGGVQATTHDQLINQLICFAQLLSQINNRPFIQVQHLQKYQQFMHQDKFLKDLYAHYQIEGKLDQFLPLLAHRVSILTEEAKSNPLKCIELQKCKEMQTAVKIKTQKQQATYKTYSEFIRKLNYNPLRVPFEDKNHPFVTPTEINHALSKLKPINRSQKCHYHFLKAKQAWISMNLNRSLSHLQKAITFTASPKWQSKIHLEMGRIWSHLCNFTKAQDQYYQCLQLIESSQGCESIDALAPLENLIILNEKMGRSQKGAQLTRRCEWIKKKFNFKHFRMMFSLVHSISTPVLFDTNDASGNKQKHLISKDDIIKMQIDRIPPLAKIWHIIRPFLEKADKTEQKNLQQCAQLFQFGEMNMLFYILKLINHFQKDILIDAFEESALLETVRIAEQNNKRMYYRLMFLLSYYYQKNNEMDEAVNCLRTILSSSTLSAIIKGSVRKRILQLAKKGELKGELRQIYSDVDWLSNEGMMEELWNAILFLRNDHNHMACIKGCNKYLQSIKLYTHPSQIFRKNSKTVNRTDKVQFLLIESLIQLQIFTDAWTQLKTLASNKKTDKKQLNLLAATFCKKTFLGKEYSLCIESFLELIRSQILLEQPLPIRNDVWVSVVSSLIITGFNFEKIEEALIKLYDSLAKHQEEIAATALPQRIASVAATKQIWRNLNSKINGSQESTSSNALTFQKELESVCDNYNFESAKNLLKKQGDHLQKISSKQIRDLMVYIVNLIMKLGLEKGQSSQIIVYLHIHLFQLVSFLDLQQEQILLLLYFSSFSHRLINAWEQQLWGDVEARQLLLDRILAQFFKSSLHLQQSQLDKLWWVDSQRKNLLKLWASYRKIIQSDEPTKESVTAFRIQYGSYFSQDEGESSLLRAVGEQAGHILDEQL